MPSLCSSSRKQSQCPTDCLLKPVSSNSTQYVSTYEVSYRSPERPSTYKCPRNCPKHRSLDMAAIQPQPTTTVSLSKVCEACVREKGTENRAPGRMHQQEASYKPQETSCRPDAPCRQQSRPVQTSQTKFAARSKKSEPSPYYNQQEPPENQSKKCAPDCPLVSRPSVPRRASNSNQPKRCSPDCPVRGRSPHRDQSKSCDPNCPNLSSRNGSRHASFQAIGKGTADELCQTCPSRTRTQRFDRTVNEADKPQYMRTPSNGNACVIKSSDLTDGVESYKQVHCKDTVWTVKIMKDAGITARNAYVPVMTQTSMTTVIKANKLETLLPRSERFLDDDIVGDTLDMVGNGRVYYRDSYSARESSAIYPQKESCQDCSRARSPQASCFNCRKSKKKKKKKKKKSGDPAGSGYGNPCEMQCGGDDVLYIA